MTIEQFEERVIDVSTDLGTALIYDIGQLQSSDWDGLADELAELASLAAKTANRYAAYAGIARRHANLGAPE